MKNNADTCTGRSASVYSAAQYRGLWVALLLGTLVCVLLALLGEPGVPTAWNSRLSSELLWLALIYPAIEEWLFRGVIQSRLLNCRYGNSSILGISVANAITTVLFMAAHLMTLRWPWALLVGGPSLMFGWFRDRYRSILPAIILHSWYNAAYFILCGLPE